MSRPDLAVRAISAREAGLVGCTHCAKVWPVGTTRCRRCGQRLVSRDHRALSRVWAWWAVGLMAYIPANLYPMLVTRTLFGTTDNTIVGGAVDLALHGSWGVAFVILLASVGIPIAKFLAIGYLAVAVQRGWRGAALRRMQLFELVEFIGRWSMIDVFVVAILASLVQLSVVASINPGPAALAFALSVIFTMLAARSFDSRQIWDSVAEADRARPPGRDAGARARRTAAE
ncbi:MAG: paraquat-inducible membrane protein A [Deinococcus-Thermus bacterium]|jgi:paraquat-inducible protein A|nr:paraquat-inducible membrane protein A [Deinococcota bacterium]